MGAEARVAIAEDLVLDFSGLFSGKPAEKDPDISPVEPLLDSGEYKTPPRAEKPAEGLITPVEGIDTPAPPEQAKILLLDRKREQEARQRSLEVYKTYQENTKRSGQLQTEILKGIAAGEDVYSLFLKAAKAISLMTSNTVFYSQTEADIAAIYGRGLNYAPPLQKELQETQARLQRLLDAEQREPEGNSKERIKAAIKAHRAEIERLKGMITKTGTKQSGEL